MEHMLVSQNDVFSCQTVYFNLDLSDYIQNTFIKNRTQQMANAKEVFINTGGLGPSLKINKSVTDPISFPKILMPLSQTVKFD